MLELIGARNGSALGRRSIGEGRSLEAEWLDDAPFPAAQRNLQDLARINRWFGGHRALLEVFRTLAHPYDHFTVLDVGAASGDMGQCLRARYRNAVVVSLDHHLSHLRCAPGPRVAAEATAPPFDERSFDFVLCSQFLHHFSDRAAADLVKDLLRLSKRALVIFDLERHPIPYRFLPWTRRLFGWSDMTVHDGSVSVAAAFTAPELLAIAGQARAERTRVQRHWPWFRISVVLSPNRCGCAFGYFLTSDGAGRVGFPVIARPNSEGLTGTGSMMSSGTL